MARNDLIVTLVQASASGDRRAVRSTVAAMIAEAKAHQHNGLAERLSRALEAAPGEQRGVVLLGAWAKGLDYLSEIKPRRTLGDLMLSGDTRSDIDGFHGIYEIPAEGPHGGWNSIRRLVGFCALAMPVL